jgi:hypothetical protein
MRALAASAVVPAMAGRGEFPDAAPAAPRNPAVAWIAGPVVAPPRPRRSVSPLLAGAVIALVIVIAVLLLRR